jgi:putative hydrolase of the HAD superfamily
MDDTLYLERDYVLSGFTAVAAWAESALGIPQAEGFPQLKAYFEAGVRGDTFNRWLADQALESEPWLDGMIEAYRRHSPQISPFPDAEPTLQSLNPVYRLGLLTEGFRAVQQSKLDALGLGHYFEEILIGGEDEREFWKPNPRPFEIILGRINIPGRAAIYVGDNPHKDFLGARRAGMGSVRLRHPQGLHAQVDPVDADHAPNYEIGRLGELMNLLETH